MRKGALFAVVIGFLLLGCKNMSCYAKDVQVELEWDFMDSINDNRDLETVSVHVLHKISEEKGRSIYRGITITRPHGNVTLESMQQPRESSAVGIGPTYLVRYGKHYSGNLFGALEISGGAVLYDEPFPAGGRSFNFMWRVGPQFVYKFNEHASLHVGYKFMHVSNGFKTQNPGYDARGVSIGLVTNF